MHLRHLLSQPILVWLILLAILVVQVSWPPKGWKAITIFVCTIIVALVLVLHFLV